jgi:hypothetical protein
MVPEAATTFVATELLEAIITTSRLGILTSIDDVV